MDDHGKEMAQMFAERLRKAQNEEAFKSVDPNELTRMTVKDLVAWQAKQDKDSPQWKLAEHEFQVRGTAKTRLISIIACVVSGLAMTISCLAWQFPRQKSPLYHSQLELQEHVMHFANDLAQYAKGYPYPNDQTKQAMFRDWYAPRIDSYTEQLNNEGVPSTNLDYLLDKSHRTYTLNDQASNLLSIAIEMSKMAERLPTVK